MKNSTRTGQGVLGFLVGACYLVSLAACGAAAYAVARLLAEAGVDLPGVYPPAGLF